MLTDQSNMTDAAYKSAEPQHLMTLAKGYLKVFIAFWAVMLMSVIAYDLITYILTATVLLFAYQVSAAQQELMLRVSHLQASSFIIFPQVFLVIITAYVLIIFKVTQGFETTFPVMISSLLVAYWPFFWRFKRRDLKPRSFNYKYVFFGFTGSILLTIIGANFYA